MFDIEYKIQRYEAQVAHVVSGRHDGGLLKVEGSGATVVVGDAGPMPMAGCLRLNIYLILFYLFL